MPVPLKAFSDLEALASGSGAKPAAKLAATLTAAGWLDPTPIQRQAIPALLKGRELLAIAPTGGWPAAVGEGLSGSQRVRVLPCCHTVAPRTCKC